MTETRTHTFNPDFQMAEASGLVERHISPRATPSTIRATVYANRVDVRHARPSTKPHTQPRRGGGKRGTVQTYSPNSQRRNYRTLAAWRDLFGKLHYGSVLFITLTLPDGVPHDPATAKEHDANLFRRIQRKFPFAGEHWRMHLEVRKSGTNLGQPVPHFHSLFVNLFPDAPLDAQRPFAERTLCTVFLSDPKFCKQAREYERLYAQLYGKKCRLKWQTDLLDAFRIWLVWAWYETVGSGDVRHLFAGTDVKWLRTRDQVRSHIHYLARAIPEALAPPSQTQQEPVEPESSGQAPREQTASPSIGRLWGQRGRLDRAPAFAIRLTEWQFVRLRRLILAHLRANGGKRAPMPAGLPTETAANGSAGFRPASPCSGWAICPTPSGNT